MIISMKTHATKQEIDHVCARIQEFGFRVHSIAGEQRVVIGVVGVMGVMGVAGVFEFVSTDVPPPPPPPPPHAVRVAAIRETSTTDDFIFVVLVAFDRWQFAGTNRKAALLVG